MTSVPKTFMVAGHEVHLLNENMGVIKIFVDWEVTQSPSEEHKEDFKKKADWVIRYLINEGLIANPKETYINLSVICQTNQKK